jgi:type I restriction enzyme S subunit
MKVNYVDYIKKTDVCVLVAEAIFSELSKYEDLKCIGEIATSSSGGTPLRGNSDFYNGDIPWLKSGELNDGYIENTEEFITEKGLKNSSAKLFPEGTLLLAMYGATAGKTGITKIKVSTNQAVCALFPKEEIKRDFLYWFLRQHRYKFIEISKGGAQPNISQTVINQTQIPLPIISVQEKIISVLFSIQKKATLDLDIIPKEYIDAVVKVFHTKQSVSSIESENINQLTLLKNLRQQILQDAVQGKLVPQNPNDEPASKLLERIKTIKGFLIKSKKLKSGKSTEQSLSFREDYIIPDSWDWCKTDDIFFVTKLAGFEYTDYIKLKESGDVPVIRAQNVRPLNIDKTNLLFIDKKTSLQLDRCSLTKKCLLVTFIGAGIGDVATFNEKERWHLAPNVAKMEPFEGCEYMIEVKFINYFLMSNIGQRELFKHIKATAQPSLSMGTIRDIDIPLPPLPEQHRILAKIDQLMQLCDSLEQSIQQNQQYTQELLQVALKEALEGK